MQNIALFVLPAFALLNASYLHASTTEVQAVCCTDKACETPDGVKEFHSEGIAAFTTKLFDTSDFPARWYCGDWSSDVGWLHIVSDFGIFSAYFAIPVVLLFFLRRKPDLPFPKIIWLFAAFILACGLGHLVEAGIFWWPVYRFSGLIKAVTAIISWVTVLVLIRLMPTALQLPSAALLADKLTKSQERLDIALDAAQIGVWEVKLADNTVVFDERTREIFGLDESGPEAPLDVFVDAIHPEDQERVKESINDAITRKQPFCCSFRVLHADGSFRHVQGEGKVVLDANQDPEQLVGVSCDVTEKHAKAEQVEKLSLVASKTQHSVVIADANGKIEWINDAFTRLTGYTLNEVRGLKPGKLLQGAKTDPECIARISSSLARRESIAVELVNYHRDGTDYWIELKIDPVLDESGELTNFIATQVEITERKLAEESLQQAKQVAEQASRAKSEFLASMSHELRTPLNGVIGMTELLANSQLEPRQQRFLNACQKSGQTLLTLINDILDFSKIESGKLELEEHTFDLLQLMDDAVESMAYRVEEKGLQLRHHLVHPTTLLLKGDSHRLRQVIVNLLGNAIKFTSEGMVSLEAIPLEVTPERVTLHFRIKDTGIGIPEDRLEKLFRDFSQVDSSTSRRYGGTGLGLSISKSIVEAMGGEIGVKSIEGLGSEFWFKLSLERQREIREFIPIAPSELSGLRVFVADTSHEYLEFMREACSAWGMTIETCDSQAALQSALTNQLADRFDLLMLDHAFTENHDDLSQAIEDSAAFSEARVFLVVSPEKPIPQATEGFARCFRKPIGQSALLDSIVECFCAQDVSPQTREGNGIRRSEGNTDPGTRPLRILLAEDNATNQLFAQEVLLRQGWHCDMVSNGREAIQAIDRADYDVVLMDCQMPEMDGFEATRTIRRREHAGERSSHVPIVALTANAIKGDRERCLEAGMDEYLSKPYKPKELTDLIDRLCGSAAKPTSFVANENVGVAIADESPIDVKLFVEERCMGDIAFAQSLLESFSTNSVKRLDEIIAHWQARDAMAAGEAAHGLKGIAGIVTANRLSDLADRIESAGKSNDLKSIEAMIDDLKREVASCSTFAHSIQLQSQG